MQIFKSDYSDLLFVILICIWGAILNKIKMAENKPFEPEMDNANVGKNMKKLFTIILISLGLISIILSNPIVVTGNIYDTETKKPIIGANIISGSVGTTTDEFGGFILNISDQSEIKIIMIGYNTKSVGAISNPPKIYLKRNILKSNPIIVSANRVIPGVTPVAYSSLTADEISAHYSMEDVPMILSTEPGIHAYNESGNGTGYSYVSIRGFDQSRIAVMLDNVPLNDNESHQVYWVDHGDILSDASDVEIQRGIGNSLYGATAFGGSINVQTKISSPIEELKFGGLLGSYDTYKGSAKYSSGKRFGDKWSLNTRLSSIKSNGYRDYSKSNQTALNLGIEHKSNNMTNQFRVLLGKENSELQWDGISKEKLDNRALRTGKMDWTVPFTDDFFQQIYSLNTQYIINSNLTFRNVAYLVKGSGYYEVEKFGQDFYSYNLDISNKYSDEQESEMEADFTRRKWIQNQYYGIVPILTYKSKNIRTDIGLESRIYEGNHFGEIMDVYDPVLRSQLPSNYRYYEYSGNKNSYTAFGHAVYSLPIGLHFVGDIQVQKHNWSLDQKKIGHAQGHQLNANWNFMNPRLGFSYDLTKNISLFGNYGTAEKEPSDAQIIDADDVWSEPKVAAAEKIFDKEGGVNFLFNNKYLKINGYRIDYKNEIISDIYDFAEGEFDIESAEATRHEGIEVEGGWELSNAITLRINGSWSKNRFKSGEYEGKELVNVPSQLANITVNYSPQKIYGAMLHGKFVGRQYIDKSNAENISISPYLIFNMSGWLQFSQVKLTARVNNIFDSLYSTYGYEYYGGYYWPGATRNFSLSVEIQI